MKLVASIGFALLGCFVLMGDYHSKAFAEGYYKGKTLRIIVGSSPGGGFDAYARLIGRHIGKYLPGHPTLVVQNMTGAGNLIAANYTYLKAKPDGLTMGHWVGGLVLHQALGKKGIKFDARKFEWVGVPKPSYIACVVSKKSGVTSFKDWQDRKKPLKLGGMGPGSSISDVPRLLKELIGLPIHLIEGYGGAAPIRLAIDRGEVDGGCWGPDVIIRMVRRELESGEYNFVVQTGDGRHSKLPDVPNAMEYVKTDEAKTIMSVGIDNRQRIMRGFMLPPKTPKKLVDGLRSAFLKVFTDTELLAQARKAKMVIAPIPGERVQQSVNEFFSLDPVLAKKLKAILIPG